MTEVVKEIEQEALQRGRQEGEHLKATQVAEKLFRKGASVSGVVDVTRLSETEDRLMHGLDEVIYFIPGALTPLTMTKSFSWLSS